MRTSILVPIAALLGLLCALPATVHRAAAEGRASRTDILPVSQIKPGMKGYGLTVFEGTRPQKFDVEVIDVLHNFRPRQELIIVKTAHPRLEVAKVVAGMSGSPIFIDGKMIGAYAYGWSFGAEPIAGVTPIRSMLDDLARPLPAFIHGWPLRAGGQDKRKISRFPGVAQKHRFAGTPGTYNLELHRDQIRRNVVPVNSQDSALVPVSTPVLLGGLTADAAHMAKQLLTPLGLEPLQAGGGGANDPSAPTRYENGGAIGVQLIRGDMNATGLGTVTRVEGDKVSAFGHPMMNAGVTALPTAVGKILWFLASRSRSFKIGMPVRSLGALVNDRQASIVALQSAKAPVIPVKLSISGVPGAPHTDWNFQIAHEKFMAPSFVAVALGSALQATAADRQDVSWTAEAQVSFKGYGTIEVEDFGVAVGGTPDPSALSRSNIVAAIGAVLNNPWEPAFVESIQVKVRLRYSRDIYQLQGAELLDPEVKPGDAARVRLTLVPFAGPTVKRTIKVPLPRHLAGQSVTVMIRPGYAVNKQKAFPQRLSELVANLEDPTYPPQSVVFSYASGAGLAYQGNVANNLPAGALDLLTPQSTSLAPKAFGSQTHVVRKLSRFVVGSEQVKVKVKSVVE